MEPTPDAVAPHAALLRQGLQLLEELDDATYREAASVRGWGCVGAQMRHVVEFYGCFLRGLPGGRIDYSARPRRTDLERDRGGAAGAFASVLDGLRELSPPALSGPLTVRDEDGAGWSASSVGRELSFLLSHTVHHFALVRMMLAGSDLAVDADFGVASSTLRHWAERP